MSQFADIARLFIGAAPLPRGVYINDAEPDTFCRALAPKYSSLSCVHTYNPLSVPRRPVILVSYVNEPNFVGVETPPIV